MGETGFCKHGWRWFRFKNVVGRLMFIVGCHWPPVCSLCVGLRRFLLVLVLHWRDCHVRGFCSLLSMDSAAVFLIMWSGYLSLTSTSFLVYGLLLMGTVGATTHYLDYISGLLVLVFFGILALWICGYFWVTAILFITAGYIFSMKCARLFIFVTTTYSIYRVYAHAGWLGIFLSLNTTFISNDLLYTFVQAYGLVKKEKQFKDYKDTDPVREEYLRYFDSCAPTNEAEDLDAKKQSCRTSNTSSFVTDQKNSACVKVEKTDPSAIDEMKRIISSLNHYEAVGFLRNKYIDQTLLRKEYRKKAMLVHPDKNMGNPLAGESFKKLQCAYEVLSDMAKKKDYDEQLRREESRSICKKSSAAYRQSSVDYRQRESRRIECTRCRKSHLWICTSRSKIRARWCQHCHLHHPAKDGDGWIESECSTAFSTTRKMNIPRALACAESKIFDVSEWVSCQFQGTPCRPNTHCPSFHVNKVGVNRSIPRLDLCRYQWELRAEMITEEEEFEIWLEHAMATGLLTSKQNKTWRPFKILNHTKGKLRRRMSLP